MKLWHMAAVALGLTVLAPIAQAEPKAAQKSAPIEQCIYCHGVDGIAPDAEVPHLAGQNERYLLNQMMAFRAGKRPHKEMRYMSRHMSEDEIAAIAAYYASLPR